MVDYKKLTDLIYSSSNFNGTVLYNESMQKHTTFKIGGTVPEFFEVYDSSSLLFLIKEVINQGIKYFVLGGGSNIVFCDGEYDGIVISLQKMTSPQIQIEKQQDDIVLIKASSGFSVSSVVNYCTKNDLWGFEEFSGLPGTIGGAVFMNARCFDKSISDLFVSAEYIDLKTFLINSIQFNTSDWDYKKSPFQDGTKIITSCTFKVQKKIASMNCELVSLNKKFIEERKSKGHFEYPSAGSVFKNNRDFNKPSGKLIDECGLKGFRIGQAQIAPFHGNFIINLGGATQKDVKNLVEYTVNQVREKKGFDLQPEIIFVS